MREEENDNVKHDVAFSFRGQDLPLAKKLADAIAPLVSFVYARKQEELAGTDGLESLRAPFRDDSRMNVILFRDGWGATPWTRVEETAIKDRCLADGWKCLLIINVDGTALPKWVPETVLHLDLQTYPFDQAVGAIKLEAQRLGGKVRPPSQADLSRAKLHAAEFAQETNNLFRKPEGIQLADEAVRRVGDHLVAQLQQLSDEGNRSWDIKSGWGGAGYGVIRVQGRSVLINWQRYANDCHDSEMLIRVLAASFETPEESKAGKYFLRFSEEKAEKYRGSFKVTRTPELGVAWGHGGNVMSSEDVADKVLSRVVDALAERG